jgi:uncharacterized membrane protein YcjF (UPF0283 family)
MIPYLLIFGILVCFVCILFSILMVFNVFNRTDVRTTVYTICSVAFLTVGLPAILVGWRQLKADRKRRQVSPLVKQV